MTEVRVKNVEWANALPPAQQQILRDLVRITKNNGYINAKDAVDHYRQYHPHLKEKELIELHERHILTYTVGIPESLQKLLEGI